MVGFLRYYRGQMKRIGRLFPAFQAAVLLLILCLGAAAWLFMKNGRYEKAQTRFEVGLVGNTEESYMDFGINVIQSVDSSRYMVDFQTLTLEEARQALLEGRLSCYVRIPDGLVESLAYGRNDKRVECVTDSGGGIFLTLAGELTEIVSSLILNSQSAVFGMQTALYHQGMSSLVWEYTEDLNLRFFDIVLSRTELCKLSALGYSEGGISTLGYYLGGSLIFLLLLCGTVGGPLFAGRNRELFSLTASKGIGAIPQVLGEYLAWSGINLLCFTECILLLGVLRQAGIFEIIEWRYLGAEALTKLWLLLVPVSFMLSALQFLIYESVSGIVSGVLMQFISAIVMGYLAGCFYPYTFFPDILQRIGVCLPAGAAVRFVQGGITGEAPLSMGLEITVYLALFLGLSVAARKLRIEGGQ